MKNELDLRNVGVFVRESFGSKIASAIILSKRRLMLSMTWEVDF